METEPSFYEFMHDTTDRITAPIDARMCVESQVWAELDESVQQGWRTQDEAEELYAQWFEDWSSGNI